MLHHSDIVHIVSLSALNMLAMIVNAFFMFVIYHRTPKVLHTYSVLLFNIACVDFLAAFSSLMCIPTLQYVDGLIVLVYLGPCTLRSAQLCLISVAFHCNLLTLSVLLLLKSFVFRLWVLKHSTEQQMKNRILWPAIRLTSLSLSLINTVALTLVASYEVPGFPSDHTFSAFDLTGGLTDNVLPRIPILVLLLTHAILFVSIIFMHRRLYAGITKLNPSDSEGHKMIYRSLTAQMLLPVGYVAASCLWLLDFTGIVSSRSLQRSIFVLSSFHALVSPLINMYYIPPYRRYIKSLFSGRQIEPTYANDFTQQSESKH